MWDNAEWAQAHIKKKHPNVTVQEAWEVVFEWEGKSLISPDQLHYPPFRRYWKIGKTKAGKLLLVAWEVSRETRNLITAYPPSEGQVKAYESKVKKYKGR
jgi:uncharacterized DUF497 family protein